MLGAINAEIESQKWRQLRREEYNPPLASEIEAGLRKDDEERRHELQAIAAKIRAQLK